MRQAGQAGRTSTVKLLPKFIALVALVPCIANSAPIEADDGATRTFAVQGVGLVSCERFLQERQGNTKLYWNIGGWIDGFLTGYNAYVPETYDISAYAPRQSADSFTILLARYCQNNKMSPIGPVIKSIADQLHPIRIKNPSDIVEIEIEGQSYDLYRETLRMAQRNLRRLDYYDGKVDGVFGAKTRAAIERFQTSEGITVSGAPNEDTLLRLLFKTVSDNVDDN
jgi:hypothetical protein